MHASYFFFFILLKKAEVETQTYMYTHTRQWCFIPFTTNCVMGIKNVLINNLNKNCITCEIFHFDFSKNDWPPLMIEGSECQSVRDSDVLCIHEKCKLIWNYWHVEKPKWKIKHTFNRISKTCSVSKCYEWNITKWNKLALYCQLWSYIYFAIGFFKFLQSRYV